MDDLCELTFWLAMNSKTRMQVSQVSQSISWLPSLGHLNRSMMASTISKPSHIRSVGKRTLAVQGLAIDGGAVRAAQVAQQPSPRAPAEGAVLLGHARVLYVHGAGLGAAHRGHHLKSRELVKGLSRSRPLHYCQAQQVRRPLLLRGGLLLPCARASAKSCKWIID